MTSLNLTTSYLSFKLGNEVYAANVSKVSNILEMSKITTVPRSPKYMLGVINLRGTVLPLIDARIKLGLIESPITNDTCILVLELLIDEKNVQIGALVDSVLEVLDIEEKDILPAPNVGYKHQLEFVDGIYKSNNDVFITLLNMDKVISL